MLSLPATPHSGQYFATGASKSSFPWSARRWAHKAQRPLVVDQTLTIVSRCQRRVREPSMCPPHKSTTGRPPTVTATAAPTSPRLSQFSTKACLTRANRASHSPSMVCVKALPQDLIPPLHSSHNRAASTRRKMALLTARVRLPQKNFRRRYVYFRL